MAFTLERFSTLRPFVYHLTAPDNLPRIRSELRLNSASALMQLANRSDLLLKRRIKAVRLKFGDEDISLQNQYPLHEGNVDLEGMWTFADLVREVNRRVFFWPGTPHGPIPYGVRHAHTALWEQQPITLKVDTRALFAENEAPQFCAYNSGSPRCSHGRKSPRGPHTFLPSERFDGTSGDVVEVVLLQRAHLPRCTQYRRDASDDWKSILVQEAR